MTETGQTKAIVKAFRLQSAAELKVVLSALILSECVYKLVDVGSADSAKAASAFASQLPPGLVSLSHMQTVAATVPHRYMLGDDGQFLYVVFMGTKHMRDLLSDANFLQEAVWTSQEPQDKQQGNALAHRGFLARARGIPVEALYAHAVRQGRRLVMCGHSLGGAVALLCTLRLLQGLPKGTPSLHCICFGTPAIGNAALAALVAGYGWERHILNFILPEDIIPRMLALPAVPAAVLDASSQEASSGPQQVQDEAFEVTQPSSPASGSVTAAVTIRSRLQNLRAILTAKKPDMQLLDAATAQRLQSSTEQEQPAEQTDAAPQQGLGKSSQLTLDRSRLPAGVPDQRGLGNQGSEQLSDEVNPSGSRQPSSRLQGLRDALAASWQPKQQQQQQQQEQLHSTPMQDLTSAPDGQLSENSALSTQADQMHAGGSDDVPQSETQAGRPVLQGFRSFTNRLPGFKTAQALPDKALASRLLPANPPSTEPTAGSDQTENAAGLTSEQQPATEARPGSRLWRLNNRVQGAWIGASSRAKAMRALLPAYPAYVHIGSHQILLPASPAMTAAVRSAQQKGLAEEQQQALIMHRMSAYRGRAIAICRSVFHWEPAKNTTQISLSTTLAPPITLIQAAVTIPPLPLSALGAGSHQVAQPAQTDTQLAVADHPNLTQTLPAQSAEPQQPTAQSQQDKGSALQQHDPSQKEIMQTPPVQYSGYTRAAGTWMQRRKQPQKLLSESSCLTPAQIGLLQNAPVPLDQQQGTLTQAEQAGSPVQQAAGQTSPGKRQKYKQRHQIQQSVVPPKGSLESVTALTASKADTKLDSKPGRWLPPVNMRWQGKPKPPPTLLIHIRVQGSVHGMPTKAHLHVLGRLWCKAWVANATPQHITAEPLLLPAQVLEDESWRQKVFRKLLWLQPPVVQELARAQPGVMLIQAEVPITLLQAVVEDAEQEQRLLQQPDQVQSSQEEAVVHVQLQSRQQQQQAPAMLLKLETDFLSKEQAVQVQLPVVWLLGADDRASQAIWQLLTSPVQAPDDATQQGASSHAGLTDTKPASPWQAAQHRLRSALSYLGRKQDSVRQPEVPRPQLETAVMSGIQYALIRPTVMRYIDLLSCVLSVLSCFTHDGSDAIQKQVEPVRQSLPSRVRVAYHRQQLQQLQVELQHLGPPSGIVLLHNTGLNAQLKHALTSISNQTHRMNVTRLGVSATTHMAGEGLYGIAADDWVMLPTQRGHATGNQLYKLHRKLRGSLTAVLHSVGKRHSKL